MSIRDSRNSNKSQNPRRRYFLLGTVVWGPTFWVAMNLYWFFKHQSPSKPLDLLLWLTITFLVSECAGLSVGVSMWFKARRSHRES